MFRLSRRFPLAALALTAVLSSCHIGPHGVDFSPITDRYQNTVDDDVILDSDTRGGSYAVAPPPALATAATAPVPASPAAAPAPAVQPKPAPAAAGGTYVVKAGDTLNGVARRHNTTPAALAAANALPPSAMLKIGQKLHLPAAGSGSHITAAKAQPGKAAAKPAGKAHTHTVQAGETLYAIARKHHVSPAALMQANKLTPQTAGKLRIGSTLTIPAK